MDATTYQDYVNILHEELVPAMGCTEPIAIAYAAAVARQTLGRPAQRMEVEASGNIIKNVKSVFVPNTGGLRGIPAAAAAGMAAGDPALELEVLSSIGEGEQAAIRQYLADTPIAVKLADSPFIFDIAIRAWAGEDSALVRIVNYHTNIVRVERNGQVLKEVEAQAAAEEGLTDKSVLTVEGILEFARERRPLRIVEEAVGRQVRLQHRHRPGGTPGELRGEHRLSAAEARRGRCEDPGQGLCRGGLRRQDERLRAAGGHRLRQRQPGDHRLRARWWCMPRSWGPLRRSMLRAVVLSDLITIHQKSGIGRLSAYCGAISAGCGSGGGDRLSVRRGRLLRRSPTRWSTPWRWISGMVCDGAKASCAAKIAAAVDAGHPGLLDVPGRPASSLAGTASSPRAWRIPSGTLACLATRGHAGDRPGDSGHHDHPLLTFLRNPARGLFLTKTSQKAFILCL